MQLRSITVRNIRSYAEGRLELRPGRTLLVGDVGSGKTSLLHAVEMALFGFAEVAPEHLVRHREREAEVTLELEEDGHRYEFRRRFRRRRVRGKESFDTEESSYGRDGVRTRYSATELKQRAIDLLGFPDNPSPRAHSDVWRWAVYIPQERMREVLVQSPDDRLETIRKALGFERYRTAAENAGELAARLSERAERGEDRAEALRHWQEDRDSAVREATSQFDRLRELEPLVARARQSLAVITAELATQEVEHGRVEVDRSRRAQLTAELDAQRRELEELRSGLGEIGSRLTQLTAEATLAETTSLGSAGDAERAESLRRELGQLERDLLERDRLSRALLQIQTEERAESRRLAELGAALGRAIVVRKEAESAESRSRLELPASEPVPPDPRTSTELGLFEQEIRAGMDHARARLLEQELELEQLQQLLTAGECPRCHQAVRPDEFTSHELEARAEVGRRNLAAQETMEALARASALRESRSEFERTWERWRELERRRSEAGETLERRRNEEAKVASDQGEAQRALTDTAARRALLEVQVERLAPLTERRLALQQELSALEEKVRIRDRRQHQLTAAREGLTRLSEEQLRLHRQLAAAESREAARREELRAIEQRLERSSDLAELVQELRRRRERGQAALESHLSDVARARQLEESARIRRDEAELRLVERREWVEAARLDRARAAWMRESFRVRLVELEHRCLGRAQAEFSRLLARNFSRLLADPALIARCDATFGPEVEIDGETTPAAALSGGERTALALAYRLAMGALVRESGRLRLQTLILDEPTDGFSPEQVLRLGELLDSLGLPQILLVSHERQLEGAVDRVVSVEKIDGLSQLRGEGTEPPAEPARGSASAATPARPRPRRPKTARGESETPPLPSVAVPPP
ncbi:MAG: SMC family ATPase [Thermoplasmata archaeon]|nr:SMC family ATPase [Thermoplasmata archaeon]